ncbi:hypothetical protein F5880DRAFT_1476387 [Lentinula raphanica]|nr:hypothetical protein F5880DRAFT_1476387 [Lentinula raphanica]
MDEHPTIYAHDRSRLFRNVNDLIRDVTETEPLGFVVKGESPQQMLAAYTALVERAIEEEDFSALLSQNRHFQLISIDSRGRETYITSGPGVEKEVMNLFFKAKVDSQIYDYLVEVIDGYMTLSTVPISSAADLSAAKKSELTLFGAATGLSLVHGIYPAKFNPLLLVYLLNSSNLKSLTKTIVKEMFPNLHSTLTRWIALNHSDNDLSYFQPHFATYHNVPVSALYGRSERHHRSLAWTMLHNAIVGPVTTDHPYFAAFIEGLLLPCKSIRFDLSKIAACFDGGINEVASMAITMHSGWNTPIGLLLLLESRTALSDAYEIFPKWSGSDFEDIFKEFLEGTGLPCPSIMTEIQGRFDDVVTLEGASEKAYRMKMFCWATTGAPHIATDRPLIEVILVDDDDPMYFSLLSQRHNERAMLLDHGTISFKTCTRKMHIPASYLLKLLTASYNTDSEPRNARDSIFHWFFVQILGSIGSYNVV